MAKTPKKTTPDRPTHDIVQLLASMGMEQEAQEALEGVLSEMQREAGRRATLVAEMEEIPGYLDLAVRIEAIDRRMQELETLLKPLLYPYGGAEGVRGRVGIKVSKRSTSLEICDSAVDSLWGSPLIQRLRTLPVPVFKERLDAGLLQAAQKAGHVTLDELTEVGILQPSIRNPNVYFSYNAQLPATGKRAHKLKG